MFDTAKALSIHFSRSSSCAQFDQVQQKRKRELLHPDVLFHSTKQAKALRCEFVNANYHISTLTAEPARLHPFLNPDYDDFAVNDDMHDLFEPVRNGGDAVALLEAPDIPTILSDAGHVPLMYTTDQKWTVGLLKILDDMNAPDYAFEAIIKWSRSAHEAKYSFYPPGGLTRARNVNVLFSSMDNATKLLPAVRNVVVPHGIPCHVIVYDFVPQLLSLLQNPDIMIQANLSIDVLKPLDKFDSPRDGQLGNVLSGSVYQQAYATYITNPERELFVPIIQWIDRTHITGNARFSLKPYMFTPAIFTEPFRRTIQAWGYHGFLPKTKLSSAQNKNLNQGDNVRNYHAQLSAVLETFRTANERLRNVTLPIGAGGMLTVDVKTCILFIIQDMQEGDMLCGRFGPHTPQIQRHCRACTVEYDGLDDPNAVCRYLSAFEMRQIAQSNNEMLRKEYSQHHLINVFDSVPLADPQRGIFGATPTETMHAYRKGMIEVVTLLVLKNVPATKKASLDAIAVHFHKTHRQTYRKKYPATDFSNGITNLTKISASERLGLVFLFVILAQYDEGWAILNTALLASTTTNLKQVLTVFEAMLCFDQWLNQPTYWTKRNHRIAIESIQTSIRSLMKMCKDDIPTDNPSKWKFPKFHELLHIVDDMTRFGATTNFCAQRPESLLIPVAKQPGRRAQKRHEGSKFELQAAQRLASSLMIATMHQRIWKTTPEPQNDPSVKSETIAENTGRATFGVISQTQHPNIPGHKRIEVRWETSSDVSQMHLPVSLLVFICQRFGETVRFCTEYIRDKYTFRCHPGFQSGSAIYDWMTVKFETNEAGTAFDVFPCRLAAVIVLPTSDTSQAADRYRLVVQCTTERTTTKSVLLTEWLWEEQYHVIEPNTIVGPCFVISIKADGSKVLETLPIEEWHSQFTETDFE